MRLAEALNVDLHYLALGEGESTTEKFDAILRRIDALGRAVSDTAARR